MVLPEKAPGSAFPVEGEALEQSAGASGTRLKIATRPATVGATWMDLFHPGAPQPPSLEARMRVIADIAGALIQIHDNAGLPRPHRRHGRLTPRHLLVGVDGSASLFTAREPFSKLLPPQPDLGYLAPELLTQSGPASQQSDVFSLGVLLWEALDNGRLFPHRRAAAISRLIARRSLPAPRIEEEWAMPLGEVAMKALSQNPDDRYVDATAFWLALREHMPAPDAARQVLSELAQRALRLELTTEIRDTPPYLAPHRLGAGASSPPSRVSLDDRESEAPARYSLQPERSSRLSTPSPAAAHDDAAWALSDPPPPPSSQLDLQATRPSPTPERRSTPPPAQEIPSAAPGSSPPPAALRPLSSPPDVDAPVSTLHVNLPRELLDASLPFYVSNQSTSRPFPWGALSFAALIFFGVGAAVAFGAVTALRGPPSAVSDSARASTTAPVAEPAIAAGAPAAPPAPLTVSPMPVAPVASAPATPEPAAALPAASPPGAAVRAAPDDSVAPPKAVKAPVHRRVRRSKSARPKRPKTERAPRPKAVLVAPAAEPTPEIIRNHPVDDAPVSTSEGSGSTANEPLPFIEQPY